MSAGVDLLREFWRIGVRVELASDRFRLTPPKVAPDELRNVLRHYRPEVSAILEQLPAADRCQICGESTNGYGKSLVNCGECAAIAVKRVLRGFEVDPDFMSLVISQEVSNVA